MYNIGQLDITKDSDIVYTLEDPKSCWIDVR